MYMYELRPYLGFDWKFLLEIIILYLNTNYKSKYDSYKIPYSYKLARRRRAMAGSGEYSGTHPLRYQVKTR
jgi:hypothetical protein